MQAIFDAPAHGLVPDNALDRQYIIQELSFACWTDATTLLKFRRLLEKYNLTRRIFDEINVHLPSKGLVMREGTVVDDPDRRAAVDEEPGLGT